MTGKMHSAPEIQSHDGEDAFCAGGLFIRIVRHSPWYPNMMISQFDWKMYQDEMMELREEMTQLLISMEYYHQNNTQEDFDRWWTGEGRERHYFACKARIEQIQNFLSRVQVREEKYARMRTGGGYGTKSGRTGDG